MRVTSGNYRSAELPVQLSVIADHHDPALTSTLPNVQSLRDVRGFAVSSLC